MPRPCFELNGEVFACGEVVSPTSSGMEKGQILAAAPYVNISNIGRHRTIPDISLIQSLSEECMSPHGHNPVNPDWDMTLFHEQKSQGKQKKTLKKKVDGNDSLWKKWMFRMSLKKSRRGPWLDPECPTCQSLLFYQENKDKEQLPPFCTVCKSYYVKEGQEASGALESLVSALTSDDDYCKASRNSITKGKIVVIPGTKNETPFPELCGLLCAKFESNTRLYSTITRSNDSRENVSSSYDSMLTPATEEMSQLAETSIASSPIASVETKDILIDTVDDEDNYVRLVPSPQTEIQTANLEEEEFAILRDPQQV